VQRQREEGPDPSLTSNLETARKALGTLSKQEERLARRLRDADDTLWALVERELHQIEQEKRQLQATIDEIE